MLHTEDGGGEAGGAGPDVTHVNQRLQAVQHRAESRDSQEASPEEEWGEWWAQEGG